MALVPHAAGALGGWRQAGRAGARAMGLRSACQLRGGDPGMQPGLPSAGPWQPECMRTCSPAAAVLPWACGAAEGAAW